MGLSAPKSGFTVIEIVAVMAVMAVVLLVVISRATDVHADVHAEAQIIKSHIRHAQTLAMASNAYSWSITFGSQSYTLNRNGAPSPVRFPGESTATRALPARVMITSGAGTLNIGPDGSPGNADHVLVLNNGIASVTVTRQTGLVP